MQKQEIIKETLDILNKLPVKVAKEILYFAEFLKERHENDLISQGIKKIVESDTNFDFLHQDEDIYTEADLKKILNA